MTNNCFVAESGDSGKYKFLFWAPVLLYFETRSKRQLRSTSKADAQKAFRSLHKSVCMQSVFTCSYASLKLQTHWLYRCVYRKIKILNFISVIQHQQQYYYISRRPYQPFHQIRVHEMNKNKYVHDNGKTDATCRFGGIRSRDDAVTHEA